MVQSILSLFEDCSGLSSNLDKCQLAPILYALDQVCLATSIFPGQLVNFPVKYLGMPLAVAKLPRAVLQPLHDSMADHLPTWKGRLLCRSGRLTLIKTTLSAMPIYTSIRLGLLMDEHILNLRRKISSRMETGAKTSSSRWPWCDRPQSLWHCSTCPLTLAVLYGY
jgi:hypothetical protein